MKYLEPSYEVELIETADIMINSNLGENDTEEINPFALKNTTSNNAGNVLGLR